MDDESGEATDEDSVTDIRRGESAMGQIGMWLTYGGENLLEIGYLRLREVVATAKVIKFEVNDGGGNGRGSCSYMGIYTRVDEYDDSSIWREMRSGLQRQGVHKR